MPKRDELPPLERAISDTLDEWLMRMHGIVSSWSHPYEFIEFLEKHGYTVVKFTRIPMQGANNERTNADHSVSD